MNPELENYLKQARAMGKSNEIITQELSSGGWSSADISQALGLGTTAPMSATASVTTGIMSGKIIASTIIGLVVLGGGGVLVWNKMQKKSVETQAENALEQTYGGNADVKIGDNGKDIQIKTDRGSFTTNSSGNSMPAGWPSEITQYPSSKISTSFDSSGGSSVLGVILITSDSPDKVIEYYRPILNSNGWTNIKTGGFSSNFTIDGEKNGHVIGIIAGTIKGETRINMVYRNKD